MDLGLRGRSAVILGGTRGIGRSNCEHACRRRRRVWPICARNADQVRDAVTDLQKLGVRVAGASVDITDGAALKIMDRQRRSGARWHRHAVF